MISGYVTGDAEVVAKLDRLNARMQPELISGIQRLTVKLQNMVRSDKLSGQVLKVRTGRLRNSVGRAVSEEGTKVVGVVSTPVKYAKPHEYGFSGTVSVRESLRTIKQAFGRPISPRQITVSAHSMKMHLPERSFLRSALDDLQASGAIETEMQVVIDRASA